MARARRLVLAAVVCLAALAGAAPAASAQMELVEYSQGGQHCPPVGYEDHVATGGCVIHGESTEGITFTAHTIFGETNLNCDVELVIHVDEDGTGFMTDFEITNGTSDCSNVSAETEAEGEQTPWPFSVSEDEMVERLPAQIGVHLVLPIIGMQSGTLEGGTFSETNCCVEFEDSPIMGTTVEVTGQLGFFNEQEDGQPNSTVAHVS